MSVSVGGWVGMGVSVYRHTCVPFLISWPKNAFKIF